MRPLAALLLAALLLASCGNDDDATPTPSPTGSASPTVTASPPPTITPSPTAGPTPEPTPSPTPTQRPAQPEPLGFPLDPSMRVGLVVGEVGSRTISFGAGPTAETYTRDAQPSGDPDAANAGGWNCRVHVEYEGQPAVDWYIPPGTPIVSTMDGTATLYAITVTNAFDYWGVDREPYLGNPDRSRASIVPFPGPSGGKGVFVIVENDTFETEYAHFDLDASAGVIPQGAFLPGYSPDSDWDSLFAAMRGYLDWTPLATWEVQAGDVIGLSGDSGYSEAPHLHYTVAYAGSAANLCPTAEAGFADGGWLLR